MEITNGSMSYSLGLDYEKALKGAKQMLAALGDVNAAMEAFGDLGDDWVNITKESVEAQRKYIKSLEKEYEELAKKRNLTDEQKERKSFLSEEIDNDKRSLENMEAALKALALAEADPRKQLNALKKELQELAAAGLQDTEEFRKLDEASRKLGRDLNNFDKNFNRSLDPMRTFQVASTLKQVARSIDEIGKASGNANLEKTGQFVNALADGVQGFVQGGWIGVLVAGIGETITRVTELFEATEKLDKAMENAKIKAFSNEISELLKNKPIDNVFGEDVISNVDNALKAMEKAEDALEGIHVSQKKLGEESREAWRTFREGVQSGLSEIEAFPLTVKKSNWFEEVLTLGIKGDEFKTLGEVMKENGIAMEEKFGIPSVKALQTVKESFKDLSNEQVIFIDKMISARQALDDSLNAAAHYLQNVFGQAAAQLADNIVESFVASGNAVAKFDQIAANVGKTLAKQTIQHLIMDKVMKKYQGTIENIVTSESSWENKNLELAKTFLLMKGDLEELEPAIKAINEAFASAGAYDGDSGLSQRLEQEAQAIAEAQNMKIEALKDGYDKEVKQIKASRKQEREALERQIASSDGMMSGVTIKALREQIALSKQLEEKELNELQEKWNADIIKAKQELLEAGVREDEKRVDREYEMQQAVIDAMDDGLGKELAQMQLNSDKRIEQIRRNAEKEAKEIAEANAQVWIAEQTSKGRKVGIEDYYSSDEYKSMVKGMTEAQQKALDTKVQQQTTEERARIRKQEDDALNKSLQKYSQYTARREAIDKKYNADIAALYKKRNEYKEGSKEWVELDNAITQAFKDQDDAILDLNLEYTELNQLIAERERLEKRLQLVKEGGVDAKGKTQEELEDEIKEYDKKIKSLTQKSFKEQFDEQKNQLIANSIDQITDSLYRLAEATGSLNAEQAAHFMDSLSKGVKGFQSGSWIGLLIAGIEDTIAQLSDELASAEELANAMESGKLGKWQSDMAKMMESGGGIFGDDAVSNIRGAVNVLNEARGKLAEFAKEEQDLGEWNINRVLEASNVFAVASLSSLGAFKLFSDTFSDKNRSDVKAYFEAINKGYTKLEAHVLRTNDRGWLLEMFGAQDQFSNIKDMVEGLGYDLYDQYGNLNSEALQAILDTYTDLSAEDRKWLEEGIAYSEQYQEAMEQVAEYLENLFGGVADTIADQMIDSFLKTGNAAVDLGEVVGNVGKQMAKDLLKSMILEQYFNGLEDDFIAKIKEEGGMTAEASAYIIGAMNDAVTRLDGDMGYWNQVITGLSTLWGDAEAASIGFGTSLSSASQESIDLLNGQLNAMRAYQGRMESMMNSVLLQLSGIHNDMNTQFAESNRHLAAINSNTSEGGLVRSLGAYFG